jgi:hypothetical protein
VKQLLRDGLQVDAESTEHWGDTALGSAAGRGETGVVRFLLAKGADVNHRNQSGWTPLMGAASSGHAETVALLLKHGADPLMRNQDGETALWEALDSQYGAPEGETASEREEREAGFRSTIELLTAAQPDGDATMAAWEARSAAAARWWQRSFQRIYREMEEYEGERMFEEVLSPAIPVLLEMIAELQPYRRMNSDTCPYEVQHKHLRELYAASRVSDFLLASLQAGNDLDWNGPFQSKEYRDYMRSVGYEVLCDRHEPRVTREEYDRFFEALGFEVFTEVPFSPFYHEVVEVIEDCNCGEDVFVEHVFWPGLMFGDMLFSRAGARVRCSRAVMKKEVAERSQLYFTFWRRRREAVDLSHGWGHNSQWNTIFHRSYRTADALYHNVDGKYDLDETYYDRRREGEGDLFDDDDLTLAEHVELLTNRCFVRTAKRDRDRWPYDDRSSETVVRPHR